MPLEVCRALVKVGYPRGKVAEAYSTLEDMDRFGFLKIVPIAGNIPMAADLLQVLNLYVVDAINLATSISSSMDLVTEDRHLKRKRVREHAEKHGVRILNLEEFYASI
jgi:predicted nucleic acid-binding protein